MCALHSEQGGVCHQGQLVPGPRHGHTSALVNKLLTSDSDFFNVKCIALQFNALLYSVFWYYACNSCEQGCKFKEDFYFLLCL